MDSSNLEKRDYYAILGISRNASVEEIKQQYRTLSRQFHPDKQSPELKEYANEYFQRIDRAYQVLSDEKKRKMYDLYGEKALFIMESNTEIIKRNDSVDALDELIHTLYERELEVKAGQSGSFTLSVDATSLLNPPPPLPAVSAFMMQPVPKRKPVHISSIQIVQSIQTRVSAADTLSLTGTATASEGKGMGLVVVGYQHMFSPDQLIGLTTILGARNRVTCEVIQTLTKDCQGVIALSYGNEGVETEMKLVKQLNENFVSSLNVGLEKNVTCSIDTEYTTNKSKLATSLFVGQDLGASVNYLRSLNEELGVRGKIDCKVSMGNVSVETMLGKEISPLSKVNMNVIVGLTEVSLKLKYQRGNMNFVLPILIGRSIMDWKSVVAAYGVSAITALFSTLYYKSFVAKQREEKKREEEKKKEFLRQHKKLAALSQQQMMQGVTERKKKKEQEKKGLIILKAVYGNAVSIGDAHKIEQMEDVLDVTVPLQFLVNDSRLRLYAGSKEDYMGFWKGVEKDCKLYVRYSYNEKVYEVEVNDDEPLYLPAFRAHCMGDEKDVC